MTNSSNFELDSSAEELYKQFSGLDDTSRVDSRSSHSSLMELCSQEEKVLDYYRFLLAQATCLFAGILYNSLFAVLDQENDVKIKVFINTLRRIAGFPGFDGKIHCQLRGQQCPSEESGSESYDYELSFGNFLLDYQVAKIVEERAQETGKDIYAKLMEAFKGLSVMNIFNFSINFGESSDEDYDRIEDTLRYLVKFHHKKTDPASYMVLDEYGQRNINLTVLAAYNKVPPATLQGLVNKIKPLMVGTQPHADLSFFTTVYDVIVAAKRYREQLRRPPIEVNSVQWLTRSRHADARRIQDNVQVSRLVLSKYGANLQMASEVISSINSDGYREIRPEIMGKRLSLASEFLDLAEGTENRQTLQNEALQNIEEGLEQLQDETYDRVTIKEEESQVTTVDERGQETSWNLHEKILALLSFFKRRSTIKKKVRNIANQNVQFDEEDYAVIARNFKITEQEAAHLIGLLKACFDENGNFRRHSFEQHIPEFARYESKVFEFLWHYLKELSARKDRVSFLNALQLLIAKLKRPEEAMRVLLADIFIRGNQVKYSDRNGLMLGNILLRTYNRDERSNIELTPEEVLLVRQGLNQDMIDVVLGFIDKEKEKVIQKIRRITDTLLKSAARESHTEGDMQPRFLLYLQREMVIFFALVGGELGQSVIFSTVEEFGNPRSTFYKELRQKENLRHALQLLQVSVRALRRFDDMRASQLFDAICSSHEEFVGLSTDSAHRANVKKVMERIRQVEY